MQPEAASSRFWLSDIGTSSSRLATRIIRPTAHAITHTGNGTPSKGRRGGEALWSRLSSTKEAQKRAMKNGKSDPPRPSRLYRVRKGDHEPRYIASRPVNRKTNANGSSVMAYTTPQITPIRKSRMEH